MCASCDQVAQYHVTDMHVVRGLVFSLQIREYLTILAKESGSCWHLQYNTLVSICVRVVIKLHTIVIHESFVHIAMHSAYVQSLY